MEVKIYDVAPNSKENTIISGSKLTQATTNLTYLTPMNYATFENGGTNFYDDTRLYENGDYIGYCSNIVSNANKEINLTLTVTPKSGYVLQTDSISISFFETYCTALSIYITFTDSTTESQLNLSNDSMIINRYIDNKPISEIVIVFHETQYPNSFVKISSIDMGNTVYIDKFTHFNLLEECNVISSDCSINKFEFGGVTNLDIGKNATVVLTHNDKLYGTFYTDEVEQVQRTLYNFENYDILGKADKIIYDKWKGEFRRVPVVLEDISKTMNTKIINNVGASYLLVGYIPAKSCRYALTQVAWAIGGIIDDSREDYISINPIPTKVSSIISTNDNRIIGDAILTKSKVITKAVIHEMHNVPIGTASEGKTFTVSGDFSKPTKVYFDDIFATLASNTSGTTIIESTYNYVIFTSTATTVSFTGWWFEKADIAVTIDNPQAKKSDEENIVEFKDYTLYAISTDSASEYAGTSQFKYNQIQKYIQSKGTVKAKIVLENEKVGDLIQLETAYSGTYTGIITSMNIVSLGYQTVADIEMMEWSV